MSFHAMILKNIRKVTCHECPVHLDCGGWSDLTFSLYCSHTHHGEYLSRLFITQWYYYIGMGEGGGKYIQAKMLLNAHSS